MRFAPPWPTSGPSWHFFKSTSPSFPFETYSQFCLYHNNPSHKWKCDLIPFLMFCFISLANPSWWLANRTSFWSFVSPTYTTLSWCFQLNVTSTTFSQAYVECPHWTKPTCLAISLVLMTILVKWQSISRWHCQSTPPHLWSLCNGPKSWNNVSRPTFPFHVLATFVSSNSISCFQMPLAFHLALGLL